MNLLKETIEVLEERGYSFDDVESIQGRDERISVERFKTLADKEYDDGYGAAEVATDLVILMKDGSWFSRWEYDGSEGWQYNRRPKVIQELSDDRIVTVIGDYWSSLHDMNSPDGSPGDSDDDDTYGDII